MRRSSLLALHFQSTRVCLRGVPKGSFVSTFQTATRVKTSTSVSMELQTARPGRFVRTHRGRLRANAQQGPQKQPANVDRWLATAPVRKSVSMTCVTRVVRTTRNAKAANFASMGDVQLMPVPASCVKTVKSVPADRALTNAKGISIVPTPRMHVSTNGVLLRRVMGLHAGLRKRVLADRVSTNAPSIPIAKWARLATTVAARLNRVAGLLVVQATCATAARASTRVSKIPTV